jgi:hypothetical protein
MDQVKFHKIEVYTNRSQIKSNKFQKKPKATKADKEINLKTRRKLRLVQGSFLLERRQLASNPII